MSTIAEDAFRDLFPEKDASQYSFSLGYSTKFRPYNANVRRRGKIIEFNFSHKWKSISREIQVGLCHELFAKLFKVKKQTTNMDMYMHFMRSIHIAAPKTHSDPVLEKSFESNNEKFFAGMLEITNLRWGTGSTSKLGQYEYGSDMITISTIFKDAPPELLDYVMYHEMLHKKLKFRTRNGRSFHHPPEFRRLEAQFPGSQKLERELGSFARSKRRGLGFFRW